MRLPAGFILFALLWLMAVPCARAQTESVSDWEDDPAPWNFSDCDDCVGCCRPVTPPMFGDLLQAGFNFGGGFSFGGFQGGFTFGGFGGFGNFNFGIAIAVARGAEKAAENESPRPTSRVYGGYNYYNNVHQRFDVHRELIGVEHTVLDGNASIGLRLPYFQDVGNGFNGDDLGDVNLRLKLALVNTVDAVVSTGLIVTAPTSPIATAAVIGPNDSLERIHPWQLQPYVAFIHDRGDFYWHGFSSVGVPTDSRDVTVMYNDLGLGCRLYEGEGRLRAVIPTIEAHVNTPVNHRTPGELPRFRDAVHLTGGSYFLLGDQLYLGMAMGVPVTGPNLFDFEAMCNLNWLY